MEDNNYSQRIFYVLFFTAIVLFFALCKILSSVMLPVVSAILLAFVFKGIPEKLKAKFHIPWAISCIFIVVALLFLIFGLSSLLVTSLSTIVAEYPKYESKFMSIYKIFADKFNLNFDDGKSFIENMWQYLQVRDYVQKLAFLLSSGAVGVTKSLLLVTILFAFLLIEIESVSFRFHKAFESETNKPKKTNISQISGTIINETSRYIFIKFIISLLTGVLAYAGTKIVGLDFAIVWGFFAFLMNFIPTFGSIFSCLFTSLFALLQFYPSGGKVAFIVIYMIAVNFVLGNIIEPRIEGKELGLSPFVILVCLSLWGWLWGFVGMILAVPLTVIVKIVCENISFLNPFAILLGYPKSEKTK